jgi:hypothetical protein
MSKRWTAKCWMGSKSGYVDIEVGASSFSGAKEQLQSIYGAQQIINLRQISGDGGSGGLSIPSGGGTWLMGLFVTAGLFLYLTPWVLMGVYGAGATWIAQKITKQSIMEYAETSQKQTTDEQHKKAAIVFGAALLFGMIGFIQGTAWNSDLNKEYNLDGKQTKVEQIRQ